MALNTTTYDDESTLRDLQSSEDIVRCWLATCVPTATTTSPGWSMVVPVIVQCNHCPCVSDFLNTHPHVDCLYLLIIFYCFGNYDSHFIVHSECTECKCSEGDRANDSKDQSLPPLTSAGQKFKIV